MIISLSKIRFWESIKPITLAISLVWIAQIAAIIGLNLGYESWFLEKTPFNLLFINALLLYFFRAESKLKYSLFFAFALLGYAAEWLGVNTGLLFGEYAYGPNLGFQLQGVPLLIGINWAMLVFICGLIGLSIKRNRFVQISVSLAILLLLDVLMEQSASAFHFWYFADGVVPLKNYVTWALVALPMLYVFNRVFSGKQDFYISANLYGSQFLFFACFSLPI